MNTQTKILPFEKGELRQRVRTATEKALQSGALKPIKTDSRIVPDHGIDFLVRMVDSLVRKEADKVMKAGKKAEQGEPADPFLPHEEAMFVADISNTHLCLLNKFNVIKHHLLIVTRAFEHQERLLTVQDFEAVWRCMGEFQSLAFYNGGKVAGASQDHKHLQLIPVPMAPEGYAVPLESLMRQPQETPGMIPGLPFLHAFKRFSPLQGVPDDLAARTLHQMYRLMLQQVGMNDYSEREETLQSGPYNLLLTHEWMLLVPRSREFFETISINALGFAGALLARNPQEMEIITNTGGMEILKQAAFEI